MDPSRRVPEAPSLAVQMSCQSPFYGSGVGLRIIAVDDVVVTDFADITAI